MAKKGFMELERRLDSKAINYSGCSIEGYNRQHYREVLKQVKLNNACNGSALVLGCGAGYGAFYLRQFGFKGLIEAEDRDLNSVRVAKFIQSYMGYSEVADAFNQNGLKAARDEAIKLFGKRKQSNPLLNIFFQARDSTLTSPVELRHSVIVLDFLHAPDLIGQIPTDNLSIRLVGLTKKRTVLSYRCGTETDKVEKLGYREVYPMIFVNK